MSIAQKYSICIIGGILAEIGVPLLMFALAFALVSIHIHVSQNFIFAIALPFSCFAEMDASLPLSMIIVFATLFQWPIYGWILGSGWAHHRLKKYAVILTGFHIVWVVFAFLYSAKHPVDMWRGTSF